MNPQCFQSNHRAPSHTLCYHDVRYQKLIWGEKQLGVKKALTTSHLCSTTPSLKLPREALAIAGHQEMGRKITDQEEKGSCSSSVIKVTCCVSMLVLKAFLATAPTAPRLAEATNRFTPLPKHKPAPEDNLPHRLEQGRPRKKHDRESVCAGC